MQVELAVAASVRRKLNPDTTPLFTEHVPSEVVLLDCSALDKQHVQQLLSLVLTPRYRWEQWSCIRRPPPAMHCILLHILSTAIPHALHVCMCVAQPLRAHISPHHSLQKLHLRFCGRGLAPDVLSATVGCDQAPLLPALTTLALEGAYRLTDEALQQWLARCPGLLRLEVCCCVPWARMSMMLMLQLMVSSSCTAYMRTLS